jgi:nucleoside-diphosphate-sugar epimerase
LRLLLDAHVSGRRIGAALRERGHEVLAVDEERDLDGCADEDLMELWRDHLAFISRSR